MSRYVEALISETDVILIEVSDDNATAAGQADVVKAAAPIGEITEKARASFGQIIEITRKVAESFAARWRAISDPPDEIGLEFGLKVDAAAGTLIARAGTEANFVVKLSWKKQTTVSETVAKQKA